MAIDMSQFYQVFFDESAEHLAAMESLLLELDVGDPDPEELNAIFRAAHSIKGSAGTFGFTDLAETTHILENVLDRIRKHELALRPEMVDVFLAAGDVLKGMLAAHQGGDAVDAQAVAEVCDRLRRLASSDAAAPAAKSMPQASQGGGEPVSPASVKTFDIQFVPTRVSATGSGVGNFVDELKRLGEVVILCQPPAEGDPVGFWHLKLSTREDSRRFSEQLDFIADAGAWRIEEERAAPAEGDGVFGFFSDAPGAPEAEETAYGFFEPLSAASPGVAPQVAEDEGYGFFEPLPVVASETPAAAAIAPAVEGDGYGFFEPLPAAPANEASLSPQATTPVAEEGDGYGFFAPLPAPPAVAEAAVDVAVVAHEPENAHREVEAVPGQGGAGTDHGNGAGHGHVGGNGGGKESGGRPTKHAAGTGDNSIRVSVEKVDQLINLVGELVITQAMLQQTAAHMPEGVYERLLNGLGQLERNTRDLQESVMSIRMLPISFVFSRFPRVVRDLSGKLGKQVELKTTGENTELDKGLIEKIADPLTHLIRNSLDHGIESPEQRAAAGKAPVGTITLRAYHQGGNIVIEVGDDGAGLNRQKILSKARERGLPVSDQMTDQEVFSLIFEPGFSTAEKVTDVSGRGVGMDVVRRNIQALGGRVEIESMVGIGTRMTVRLPLTLAILDGMSVGVGDQTYILPLSYVIESLQPQAGDIKTLSNQARVIQVRGEYLPVVVLHEVFGLTSAHGDLTQGIMVVLDADGVKAALFVDALLGQHQVVIKSLEANYRRVHGVSGATIMGDGHVALILDVTAIAGMARTIMQKAA